MRNSFPLSGQMVVPKVEVEGWVEQQEGEERVLPSDHAPGSGIRVSWERSVVMAIVVEEASWPN